MTPVDWRHVVAEVADFWGRHGQQTALAAVATVVLLIVVPIVASRVTRAVRGASGTAKLTVGTAVVQAGVTWVVVTGTYVFCTRILDVPAWEAVAFAVFFEASTWVSVGMIRAHAKAGGVGFGPAGPFFWLFSACGGLLAVIGGNAAGAMIGRAVIVVIGACLWYLQILRWITRSAKPGTWRWTPRRLLVAVGAIEPGDQDVADENREWQVRRLARAMRWAAGSWPWSFLGKRALIRRGEATREDVIADARRRYAVTHLLTENCDPNSDVMRRVLTDVKADLGLATPPASEPDTPPATPPAPKRTPDRTARRTPDRTASATDVATKAAKILAKQPDIKQADLAAKVGVSERTLRRHLSAPVTADEPATKPDSTPVNGTPVPELVPASN